MPDFTWSARVAAVAATIALVGCGDFEIADEGRPASPEPRQVTDQQVADITAVASRVTPTATEMCIEMRPGLDCNYQVLVHPDPSAPMNAFHTVDRAGRPLIVFTRNMIAEFENQDEMAFVIGHEAAHHIGRHIPQRQQTAMVGGVLAGIVAAAVAGDSAGGSSNTIDSAVRFGSMIGGRVYSKDHEIEADRIGAMITELAGYDSVVGVELFHRLPDPGNQFLGSHPPNSQRVEAVQQVAATF